MQSWDNLETNSFVSIVIPTWNSWKTLKHCLKALSSQTYPCSLFEVIVVNDGSADETGTSLGKLKFPFSLTYLWQKNKGRASARNLGVKYAKGEYILFLDADIIPTPTLIDQHISRYKSKRKIYVQGKVIPHPKASILGKYCTIQMNAGIKVHPLTWNLSIKKKDLYSVGLFNEKEFQEYGYEDFDLGIRLQKINVSLFYAKQATAYHHSTGDLQSFIWKSWELGKSFIKFIRLHPEVLNKTRERGYHQRYLQNLKDILHFHPAPLSQREKIVRTVKDLEGRKEPQSRKKLCDFYNLIMGHSFFEGAQTELNHFAQKKPIFAKRKPCPSKEAQLFQKEEK